MTPTLIGRWQTRLAMLATFGVLITALFTIATPGPSPYFAVLLYVALFGLVWDVVYIGLQQLRWDRDWPAAFQVATGLWEGIWLFALISVLGLPGIDRGSVSLGTFIADYGLIWLVIFLWVQGPMRALFPFWRFHGGRIVPLVSRSQRRR